MADVIFVVVGVGVFAALIGFANLLRRA